MTNSIARFQRLPQEIWPNMIWILVSNKEEAESLESHITPHSHPSRDIDAKPTEI